MKTKHLSRSIVALVLTFIFAGFCAVQTIQGGEKSDNGNHKYAPPAAAQEEFTGVGPVVSGTVDYAALPSKARKFLEKHCDGHAVVKCEKEFTSGEFGIQLADGIEFEFDAKGNVIETEAPDGYSLSSPLLKAVVPGKLYQLLIHNGFEQSVEAVHRDRSGYRIDVSDPVFKAVAFDPSGVLTLVVND